jgi:hypothetical protein
MTHDIEIPLDKKIVFPSLCVDCGKSDPDDRVELSFLETKFSAFEAASTVLTGTTYHVDGKSHEVDGIPACKECARRLRSHHKRMNIFNYAMWISGGLLAVFLPVSLLWKGAVILAALIVPVAVGLANPPALDATVSKGIATLYFKSEKVANEFRKANNISLTEEAQG